MKIILSGFQAVLRPLRLCLCVVLSLLFLSSIASAQPPRILMALWSDKMTEYDTFFLDELEKQGFDVEVETIFGKRDRTLFSSEVRRLLPDIMSKKYDLIYTWGTTGTQIVRGLVGDAVPVVFNVVFDPVAARIVDSLDHPGSNVTGVTNGVPVEEQLDAFASIVPIKNLCFLFNSREENANLIMLHVERWGKDHDVNVTSLRSAPKTKFLDQHIQSIQTKAQKCDAVYAGADAYLGSQAKYIHEKLGEIVPLLGGTSRFVNNGWLAAYAPDIEAMGRAAGEQVIAVLNMHDKTLPLPVRRPKASLFISQKAALTHGVTYPSNAILKNLVSKLNSMRIIS